MRKTYVLLSFLIACISGATAQNYAVGKRVVNFVDTARANRNVFTDIYYPATIAGNDAPLAQGVDKFPVVVFGHGFVIPPAAYEWLADSLVKYGYIVALPSTESSLFPSHANFGADLLFLCNRLTSLNDSVSSFLYQRVIKKTAVSGHSMGGGSSFLAAAANTGVINAIFNFAAAETNPSATAAASTVTVPALIFSGTRDCIVPPNVQEQMYNNVIAPCKTYINITDALHCQFANNNGTCALGQVLSGCNSSPISQAVVFDKATTLLLPFLDFYLKDNCTRGDAYLNAYNTITGVIKTSACSILPGCGPLPVALENFAGRLVGNAINITWKTAAEDNFSHFIVEKSADGIVFQELQKVFPKGGRSLLAEYVTVDNYPYPGNSYYRLKIVNKDQRYSTSTIIKISTPKNSLAVVSVFPNPVKSDLQVELISDKTQKLNLTLYNGNGKTLVNEPFRVYGGVNKKQIMLSNQPAGIYFLVFKDEGEVPVGSIKIIKE